MASCAVNQYQGENENIITGTVNITGKTTVNSTLTAVPKLNKSGSYKFQWLRAGNPINGANSMHHKLTTADYQKKISVKMIKADDNIFLTSETTPDVTFDTLNLASLSDYIESKGSSADNPALIVVSGNDYSRLADYITENVTNAYFFELDLTKMTGQTLPERIFFDFANLTGVQLSSKITTVEDEAFLGCTELRKLSFASDSEIDITFTAEDFSACDLYLYGAEYEMAELDEKTWKDKTWKSINRSNTN
ncbi:MAG: hypothetical protein Ta2F_08300 [Termitinemataceae bacterium]|nr:MAG: hypothetical protein Ta2F_08300 [Termitinemataceae bacterium]